jgi:hypothetical protein
MSARVVLALVAALALAGCSSVPLDAEWAPLVRVERDPSRLVAPGVVTTILDAVYVEDLDAWAASYPEGSVARHALLVHEREHARRQAATGVDWFFRYLTDSAFRWDEERIGWRLELLERVAAGEQVDAVATGSFLARNYAGMVDEGAAVAWVRSVVAEGVR